MGQKLLQGVEVATSLTARREMMSFLSRCPRMPHLHHTCRGHQPIELVRHSSLLSFVGSVHVLQGLYISKETCGSVNLYDPTRHSKELGGNIIRAVVAPYPPWVLQRNSSTGIFGFDGILLELKCVVLLARGCVVVIGCSGVCHSDPLQVWWSMAGRATISCRAF